MKHLLQIEDLSLDQISALINKALDLKKNKNIKKINQKTIVANLFFESSTRTHKSFEIAEKKLNMEVINFNPQTSSVNKGETLYDTVLTMSCLEVDCLVIRHQQKEYYKELINSKNIKCSIINGGDGDGEHPTQSLLDLMTIYENFKTFKNLKIAILGDLKYSRVAHSNMKILKKLGAKIYFFGPKKWFENSYKDFGEYKNIDEFINDIDVMMLLRIQKERQTKEDQIEIDYLNEYGLNKKRYDQLKDNAIIMHPCPVNRDVEIDSDLVESKKSKILEQMNNGLYMRMAILQEVLKDKF
ncbi:aspartate carbamoyltransferase catalytic subunit [Spiroplasma tabanidicola]|uniref:Aspartate carbamoyltransferase n=1 Tax=Spiroplasma tabanidicola TaxID=324079 RepID=A0A6I6CAU3_9MOLU|nr:aspartate carbamoyltransferase catalytic subunit [Spiroplasma tabanidicola]QGS52051.1 aspartate carbamoyltransferase catalytic subunit [Spiroplasma tabanidicola]